MQLQLAETVRSSLWFVDEDPHRSEFEASNSLSAQVAKLSGLKPFPAVAKRVGDLVASTDCDIGSLTRVIRNEPATAAKLMRLANSALFQTGEPASSLDQALVRLGTSTIYHMVTALGVMGLFPGTNPQARKVRDHCVGVAAVAQAMAKSRRYEGANQLFLCGLMHDLGKLLLMQSGELDYASLPENDTTPVHIWERSKLGYDHAILGGHVMALWGLPEFVSQSVAWHHQPERAYAHDEQTASLVAYMQQAQLVEAAINTEPTMPPELAAELDDSPATAITGFDGELLEREWGVLAETVKAARQAL